MVTQDTKVAIIKCNDYEEKKVEQAIRKAIESIGGLSSIIRPNDRVLLKVNLIAPMNPEKAATTHPAIVKAMIKIVREYEGIPFVADSPGFLHVVGSDSAIEKSGIKEIADSLGVEALQFEYVERSFVQIDNPDCVQLKSMFVARLALEADVIISLPKLKCHGFTLYTGAVKNMFGVVPTKTRKIAHLLSSQEKFGNALVDVYSNAKPKLAVMDAILGMEGDGPTHGDPRQAGLILASFDSVALDSIASKIIGYNPMDISTTKLASERGLGTGDLSKIEILGEDINNVLVDFRKSSGRQANIPPFILRFLSKIMTVNLKLIKEKCEMCNICAESCPVNAITLNPYPTFNRKTCIQCFCCNEMCPEGAIVIENGWFTKLFAARRNRPDKGQNDDN